MNISSLTALYAYDVTNVTQPQVEFRQETPMSSSVYRWEGYRGIRCKLDDPSMHFINNRSAFGELQALADIFELDPLDLDGEMSPFALPYQTIGRIEMRQGRLVTFPNTMEHRIQPIELIDPTRSGHYRYISLCLVDPNYRICSTRNIPAQQPSWWIEAVQPILMQKGLPRELADQIISHCNDWPVNNRVAERLKERMAKELELCNLARRCEMAPYNFS